MQNAHCLRLLGSIFLSFSDIPHTLWNFYQTWTNQIWLCSLNHLWQWHLHSQVFHNIGQFWKDIRWFLSGEKHHTRSEERHWQYFAMKIKPHEENRKDCAHSAVCRKWKAHIKAKNTCDWQTLFAQFSRFFGNAGNVCAIAIVAVFAIVIAIVAVVVIIVNLDIGVAIAIASHGNVGQLHVSRSPFPE